MSDLMSTDPSKLTQTSGGGSASSSSRVEKAPPEKNPQIAALLQLATNNAKFKHKENWDKLTADMDGKVAKEVAPEGVTFDDEGNVTEISLCYCFLTGELKGLVRHRQ